MALSFVKFVRILIYGISFIGFGSLLLYKRSEFNKGDHWSDNERYKSSPQKTWINKISFGKVPKVSGDTIDVTVTATADTPLCSNEILRMAYSKEGHFPGGGKWVTKGCINQPELETTFTTVDPRPNDVREILNSYKEEERRKLTSVHKAGRKNKISRVDKYNETCPNGFINDDYFEPDICKFEHLHPPDEYLKKCLVGKRIKKIVITGDSNGQHYHGALLGKLYKTMDCQPAKAENDGKDKFEMDVNYFMGNMSKDLNVTVENRMCRSCGGQLHTCQYKDGGETQGIEVEHIPLPHFQEVSMQLLEQVNKLKQRTVYFSEFVFKYYMKGNYPDLLIIVAPFNHEKRRSSISTVARHTQYLLQILRKYLPNSVQVYFIPTFHEFEPRKVWQNRNKKYEGLLANEAIDELNKMLFKSLYDKIVDETSNYHAFWDMGKVSDPKLAEWMWDGMHMLPVWYENIISQFLQVVCGGD